MCVCVRVRACTHVYDNGGVGEDKGMSKNDNHDNEQYWQEGR